LKPEWWGSPLVQEKYQVEKACDKRHNNNNNNNNNNNDTSNNRGDCDHFKITQTVPEQHTRKKRHVTRDIIIIIIMQCET
jgi:hypothetical protein